MARPPFRFKKFSVEHEHSAMKVGTDGLLLGAWAIAPDQGELVIHDVGSGTGLIGLMLAQRYPMGSVFGFEWEESSAREGQKNFENAPFPNTLKTIVGDWIITGDKTELANLIVSNPPFFTSGHVLDDSARQMARQEGVLTLNKLITLSYKRTVNEGGLAIVIPTDREQEALDTAKEAGWFLSRRLLVRRSKNHEYKRVLLQWSKIETTSEEEKLTLYQDSQWTDQYKVLTSDFHL